MLQKSGWVSVMLDRVEVRPHHKGPVIDSISPADDRRDAVRPHRRELSMTLSVEGTFA